VEGLELKLESPELLGIHPFSHSAFMDERGVFMRALEGSDLSVDAKERFSRHFQVSVSLNIHAGTLRGLHSMAAEVGEYKAVTVITGRVQDIVLDIRPESPTFGHYVDVELGQGDGLVIPPGLAHGFLTLEPEVSLVYAMSANFQDTFEIKVRWDDPYFGIEWAAEPEIISRSDSSIRNFAQRS
jgi:dTDP-4-dehydrorhamnose 3,5-epimerase